VDLIGQLRECVGDAALLTRPDDTAPYLTDQRQLFHGSTLAVVEPDNAGLVSRILAWCNARNIGVVPQGGNTGYCGGATPDATGSQIVLSMRKMNRIRLTDAANFSLVAEGGCTLAAVHKAAGDAGRFFPLHLGSEGTCQIGGNLATNAGGTAVLRYGMTRELVLGIEVVLADGSLISTLSSLRKDNTGYDLKNLMIGSEGTLGVITAACLRLFPLPRSVATAWVAVADPASAIVLLGLLRESSGDRLTTCELVPAVALELVLQHIPAARDPEVKQSPWYLLVEFSSGGSDDLEALLQQTIAQAIDARIALDASMAVNEAQRENFWRLRESVPEAQRRAGASLKHDISVAVSSIPEFVARGSVLIEQLAPEGQLVAYGHVGDGNLHFNVSQRDGTDRAMFLARQAIVMRAVHDLVAQFGGSFSAEHGIGQLKVAELERYAQPAELAAMRSIKQALDPNGILNPGKVLGER
jgi:FAD/FMN-containing dehydrogenase